MTGKTPTPPDGGWGWIIVLAFAVFTVVSIPIMTSFGLLLKDTFSQIGLSATDSSIIINTNQAFGMMMGLVNGALLKRHGYRKVAIASAVCMTSGVTLTAFAKTFTHFMISFGLLTSLGMGLGMSSFSLALNTYFLKNRGKATGIAFTITGLGPIGMPQLISVLMNTYGSRGAILILAGIAAHTFPAAFLLQPIKKHWKYEKVEENIKLEDDTKQNIVEKPLLKDEPLQSPPSNVTFCSVSNTSIDNLSVQYPSVLHMGKSLPSLSEGYSLEPTKTKWWSSLSIPSVNLASSVKIFEEKRLSVISTQKQNDDKDKKYLVLEKITEAKDSSANHNEITDQTDLKENAKKESYFRKLINNIIQSFDLKLLTDKVYLNIMFGISLAVFAEMNFVMLTPFMLAEFELETSQIATFMSTIATADLIFRFISPFIGDFLKKTPRIMYLISLTMLIVARFAFIMVLDYRGLIAVAVFLGVSKGVRTVYMALVIPSYVPIERLASASGIQMVTNGCVFIFGGPLIGFIRDVSGTYRKCVMLMNLFTFITIFMWTVEMTYKRLKCSKAKTTENELS